MSNIQEWLDNNRARAARAADHVANVAAGVERWTMKVPPTDTDTDTMLIGLLDGTLGQALAALQAVLDLHEPEEYDGYPDIPDGVMCAVCLTEYNKYEEWPCPTVRAITDAIKEAGA